MKYFLSGIDVNGDIQECEVSEEEFDSENMDMLMRSRGYVKFMRSTSEYVGDSPEPSFYY